MVSIDEYCKNPAKYSHTLPPETVAYYNQICALKKTFSDKNMRKAWDKSWGFSKHFVTVFWTGLLASLTTPEGLEKLGIFMGITVLPKTILKAAAKSLANFSTEELTGLATDELTDWAASEGIELANEVILTTAIDVAAEEAAARTLTASILEGTAEFLDTAVEVAMMVQLLGMALDMFDESGYGMELTGPMLASISNDMNKAFAYQQIKTFAIKDQFGRTFRLYNWPRELFASRIISKEKKDYYKPKKTQYITDYLKNLKHNSFGEPIVWNQDPNAQLIGSDDFKKISNNLQTFIIDDNSVFTNWIGRYWLIILTIFIGVVVFILFIK